MAQGFHPVLARRLVQHVENRGILDDLDVRRAIYFNPMASYGLKDPRKDPRIGFEWRRSLLLFITVSRAAFLQKGDDGSM
jgi:hypothetical protein